MFHFSLERKIQTSLEVAMRNYKRKRSSLLAFKYSAFNSLARKDIHTHVDDIQTRFVISHNSSFERVMNDISMT